MSKTITFFRNRQQETGRTYEFRVEDPPRTYRFFIFSRKPLDEKLIQTRNLSKEGSVQTEIDKIKSAILRGQGGGAIAVIYEENRNRYLWTIPVVSQPEEAFGTVGILLPGHPSLRLEGLNEAKGIPFPPGAHALIPVDKENQESLRTFQEYLGYLPPDLESLVLHAIRDPNLDTRVGLLEALVRKDIADPAANKSWFLRLFPFLSKAPWSKRPVPVWPLAAILLGLLLIANSILLYSILQFFNAPITIPGVSSLGGSNGGESDTPAASSQRIFEVIEVVRKSSNPSLSALSQGHFSKVQKEDDLKRILVPGDDGALVARGLIKLEALRLEKAAATDLFGVANNPTQVNNFYKGRDLNAKSRDMLAAFACTGFGLPGLPKTQSAEAVRFADVNQDCKAFPLEKAAPGLDDLLKLVQETK